jgi:transposase
LKFTILALKTSFMAGKVKRMNQIKQLLIMHRDGLGVKTIARALSMSKNTVKVYLEKVRILLSLECEPYSIASLISLEDYRLEQVFHAGNPAYKDDCRYEYIMTQMEYYHAQLKETGVNRRVLWEEYHCVQPRGYSYSQFCWHLQQYTLAQKPSAVLEHLAGDKLFVDFAGSTLSYTDLETGQAVQCQVFVACLPYSDFGFAMAVRSQKVEDFIHALGCCLQAIGGVPRAIVPDNLKSAVIRSDPYEPTIQQVMEDFGNHYSCSILPARVRKPRDKALVENQVKMIYSRVFAKLRNRQFFDIQSLNAAIAQRMHAHNQTRMQKKPWSREERFLSEEKACLLPLPAESFEIKKYKVLKVAHNNHIYLSEDKNYYSVPHTWIGQKVNVIYTRERVHIYGKSGQIAVHVRSHRPANYTTNPEHLCSQHKFYRDRSPQYYLNLASKKSETLYSLFECVFQQNRYPEQLYKTCDGMLNLARRTNEHTFEKACQIALDNRVYTYSFLKKLIENKATEQQDSLQPRSLPGHGNIRGRSYYNM